MPEPQKHLGKLIAAYGMAPAYLQRAIFIIILSFVFFLAMMFACYIGKNIIYFLLASAFLAVYLVTLFSWVMQRRNHVEVFENGFKYKKNTVFWNEIAAISPTGEVTLANGGKLTVSKSLDNFDGVVRLIREKVEMTVWRSNKPCKRKKLSAA